MSQRIVTECDECGAADATTYTITTLGGLLTRTPVELDLCGEHVKPLAELVERFAEIGRKPTAPTPRLSCSYCGHTSVSRDALGKHIRREHGGTARDIELAAAGSFECPTCGKSFATPQGLGAHRSRAHGYRRPTGLSYRTRAEPLGSISESGGIQQ